MAALPEKHPDAHLAVVPSDDAAASVPSVVPSFDEVYARHAGYVAGLAGRILGGNDDVLDVVQDVFLIAHRRLPAVRNPDAVRTWLGRITVREASRRLRWRRLRQVFRRDDISAAELVADDVDHARLRPLVALLYVLLDRVPIKARTAWVLRHLLDEPLELVAELCDCSLATAKRRIAVAEETLRPIVAEEVEEKR